MNTSVLLQRSGHVCALGRAQKQPAYVKQRSLVSCRAQEEQASTKPLFQLDDRQHLNMADIMDAYEVCSLIPDPNERHQCYSVFGLDAQKMANYYETVVRLEQQLSTDLDNTSTVSGRWPHLWQQQHPTIDSPSPKGFPSPAAITGSTPPPPAAAAALAVAMLWMASKHLAWF